MPAFPQITSPPQARAEVVLNEALETLEHQAVYGKRHEVTTGLTWGFYGGRWGGFAITEDVLTLTAASSNYVVVEIATGAITVAATNTNWNDTTNYVRVYKIVAGGSAVTSVEDHRVGPGGVHGGAAGGGGGGGSTTRYIQFAASDEVTALTTGTAKMTFRMPHALTVTGIRASLTTAQASGSIFTVDVNEAGTTILSTKLTIDNTERTSTTAATPAVVSDASLADDAEITVDIDQVGSGSAAGLKITLIGT